MKTTLLSFLFFYCFIYHTVVVSAKCLQHQQSLLLQLKNNLTFDPQFSTKLTLWNENTACCNWSGVTCDKEGHVIGLDLSDELISSGLNNASSLFSLQYLQKLNLAYNYFYSSIPSGFGKLVMLNYLNLSFSYNVGNIPMEISKLTRLVTLDLSSDNSFSKEQRRRIYNRNLQTFLQNLTSLRQLYLNDINISGMGKEWGNALLPLRDLQELSCSYCDLSGPLDSSLTKLVNLSVLILDGNNFSSPVLETFSNLKKLTTLQLSYCGLIGTFPHSLSNLIHLTYFVISHNNLSGQIPHSLSNLTHLTHLDLSHNNLNGQIPLSNLTHPSSMEVIDLSFNRLSGSLKLDKIFKLKSLTKLELSYNNISVDVNVVNVDLSIIPNFRYLGLASCNLNIFPKFLINQSRLIHLDLSNNKIQGELPNGIWKLKYLDSLNISHNFLSNLEGPLQNLTSNLNYLNLRHNKLQGPIPSFPKNPYFLDYSNNHFSLLPKDVGTELSSMYFLSFSNNNIHGSIPDYLCNASGLQTLDISFNNFSGIIPLCLITITSLVALNMRKNILTGPIPDIFPDSCAVIRLNLYGNLLQGPIPRALSHCSSLKVLDIGSNQIVDSFPCFLNHIKLRVLVLRNNKFHGSIKCLHTVKNKPWKMIQIVDLAFNNFSGKLPEKYFTSWERMMNDTDDYVSDFHQATMFIMDMENYIILDTDDYSDLYYNNIVAITCKGQQQEWGKLLKIYTLIDFSSNFFEGPIPESLMALRELYCLNFANNSFSGKIPSSIVNMKQLESLDFSNNHFVGEIPRELAILSFLSYLNLSFNHLVGKIPTGTQLQTFPNSSFEGNIGLYGPPLSEVPNGKTNGLHPQPACEKLVCSIDWNFLSVELGFTFGLGMIIGPVMFWKKWRVRYWKLADKILCRIFPWMRLEYVTDKGKTYSVLRW